MVCDYICSFIISSLGAGLPSTPNILTSFSGHRLTSSKDWLRRWCISMWSALWITKSMNLLALSAPKVAASDLTRYSAALKMPVWVLCHKMTFGCELLEQKSWEENRNSSRVLRLILNLGRWTNTNERFLPHIWNSPTPYTGELRSNTE